MVGDKIEVVYATTSAAKALENEVFRGSYILDSGVKVAEKFDFDIRNFTAKEVLEVDLEVMVRAEVFQAYSDLHVPCIVEHAGLVFEEYESVSYPGGLTKPMWNSLGKQFCEELNVTGRRAIARAVVAYCDGMSIKTFTGETLGTLTSPPRGASDFYWDTVFVPDDPTGGDLTYAEIVEEPSLGLEHKVLRLSQSSKAIGQYLEYILVEGPSRLWG